MSVYTDIKLEKLENFLTYLDEEHLKHPSKEINKLIKRVEQQIKFLQLSEKSG